MATSGAMTKTIWAATGVAEPTVALVVRELREAGMLTTGARGVNAPQMTPLDAARVLLVLLVSERPADAAKAARDFGQLRRLNGFANGRPTYGDFRLEPSDGDSFEESLAAVIQKLADLPERSSWTDPQHTKWPTVAPPEISVSASINDLICRIELPGMVYEYSHQVLFDKVNQKADRIQRTLFVTAPNVNLRDMVSVRVDSIEPFYALRAAYQSSKIRVRRELKQDVLVPISADFAEGK